MQLKDDGSSAKTVKTAACCFMGLSHILYLKDYIKGIFYGLVELAFIACIPFIFGKLSDLVTLPYSQAESRFPVFMLIDGILVLSIIAIFISIYVISVRSANKSYVDYCRTKRFSAQKTSLSENANNAFPLLGMEVPSISSSHLPQTSPSLNAPSPPVLALD